jgi:hypothetical protein
VGRLSSEVVVPEIFHFHYLRPSSIGGRLQLEVVFVYSKFRLEFGPLSLSLKFEEDQISGCCDIPCLIFWGHLPLEVVFIGSHFEILVGLFA